MTRHIIKSCLVAAALLTSAPAFAGSLENLERERSIMVSYLLDADLNVAQREEKIHVQIYYTYVTQFKDRHNICIFNS